MSTTERFNFGDFRVEDWYKFLSNLTFPTEFLPLTVGQIISILHKYEANHKFKAVDANTSTIFTKDDDVVLSKLQEDLQALMDNHPSGTSFFVRLSTRSPKDACLKTEEFKTTLREIILEQKDNVNESLAVILSLNKHLIVNSSQQAINMLCASERVYTDLTRTLLFLDEKHKKNYDHVLEEQSLVLRLFHVMSTPQYEFRIFVKNNGEEYITTAITQYFKTCRFSEEMLTESNLKHLKTLIVNSCNRVHQIMHQKTSENYVLDVAYDKECDTLHVIELNPFSEATSAALFDWNKPEDKKILLGEAPFEFRVLLENVSRRETRSQLSKEVRNMLDEMFPIEEKKKEKCILQ
ncbi:hypothetical protein AKO1_006159 [Acrasis kona]|uniref:Cell division cycle protein 123 homolog n=1 Tax=Acrasis kona TaxID=1008807 RepID=A0AAW2YH60_9EUKA